MPPATHEDARAELVTAATAALRDRFGEALTGPDAIALAMVAVGGGSMTPATLLAGGTARTPSCSSRSISWRASSR